MDDTVLKKTQNSLGKVIKRPPLTEKLLKKPPFRFIHDIITEIIKNTGKLDGLFTAEELDSASITNRDAKIAFLQKLIDCVGLCIGQAIPARPSKIVAGHEAEKTNELLQSLAKICIEKIDTDAAVQQVIEGKTKPSKKSRTNSEKPNSGKERANESSTSKSKRKEAAQAKEALSNQKVNAKGEEEEQPHSKSKLEQYQTPSRNDRVKGSSPLGDEGNQKEAPKEETNQSVHDDTKGPEKANDDASNPTRVVQRPSSAKGQRRKHQASAEKDSANKPDVTQHTERVKRPSSARPAPPKVKKTPKEADSKPASHTMQDHTSKTNTSNMTSSAVPDDHLLNDGDDDTFEVIDDVNDTLVNFNRNPVNDREQQQHGSLVTKLMQSKQQAADSDHLQRNSNKVVMPTAGNVGLDPKQRQIKEKEIDCLKKSIQILCSSTHPLGKIMDYVQEDMDSMRKELLRWQQENDRHGSALKEERLATENFLRPLQSQLAAVELELTDVVERIATAKSNVIVKTKRINELVASVVL